MIRPQVFGGLRSGPCIFGISAFTDHKRIVVWVPVQGLVLRSRRPSPHYFPVAVTENVPKSYSHGLRFRPLTLQHYP